MVDGIGSIRTSRSRLYVLIDAFERDMRGALRDSVLPHMHVADALGDYWGRARSRHLNDDASADVEDPGVVDYIDLSPAWELLNRHRALLSTEMLDSMRLVSQIVPSVLGVRNRVMHGRPLKEDDTAVAVSLAAQVRGRLWPATTEVFDRLKKDPLWEPGFEAVAVEPDNILHNLPLADFDETGLVGRQAEVERLTGLLRASRDAVITVVGEGGIGKTALALQVLYDLVEDAANCPYEVILWTSLKTERLTGEGVEELTEVARDLTGMVQNFSTAFGGPSGQSDVATLQDLHEVLEGTPTLIVVDNLETSDSNDIVALYDAMPAETRFLFTSRVGLGQLERRLALRPLGGRDCEHYLRTLARARDMSGLARMSAPEAQSTVEQLRYNPLAIKWFVTACEAGRDPADLLGHQEAVVDFCVRSVFDGLSESAQRTLEVLYCLHRSSAFNELAVLEDVRHIDDLRGSMQELQRGALLAVAAAAPGSAAAVYELTPTARQFVRRLAPPDGERVAAISRRVRAFASGDERRRQDEATRGLGPNVVRLRDETDRPAAFLLRSALSASKRGEWDVAEDFLRRAKDLAPDYFEVERVEGFMASSRSLVEQATLAYGNALRLVTPEHAAAVKYHYAGHLLRAAADAEAALPLAREAHSTIGSAGSAILLAQATSYLGDHGEAERLLREALEVSQSAKERLIILTLLVDVGKRRSEYLLVEARRPGAALTSAVSVARFALDELKEGTQDRKLWANICRAFHEATNAVVAGADSPQDIGLYVTFTQELARHGPIWRGDSSLRRQVESDLARVTSQYPLYGGAIDAAWQGVGTGVDRLERESEQSASPGVTAPVTQSPQLSTPDVPYGGGRAVVQSADDVDLSGETERETGIVQSWSDRGYGFLTSDRTGERVFMHRTGLRSRVHELLMVPPGAQVSYLRSVKADGREQAVDGVAAGAAGAASLRRRLVVTRCEERFCIGEDKGTGITVLVHEQGAGNDISSVALGDEVMVDVFEDREGRLRGERLELVAS